MRQSCVKCQRFFHIVKNGVLMEEGMPSHDIRGEEARAEVWKPYKLYLADLYECPKCHTQLAVASRTALAEHWENNYDQIKDQYRVLDQLLPIVEDC